MLNLALRNTDNHARNTAVQRLVDGSIQLTPLYDFAPMYLDPELIVRGCVWRDASGLSGAIIRVAARSHMSWKARSQIPIQRMQW